MATIGGRFLVIRLLPLSDEERQEGFDRTWDEESRKQNLPKLRQLLLEHVKSILSHPASLEIETPEQQDQLNRLALLLARGRGVILTEKVKTMDEGTGEDRFYYEVAGVQIEEPYRALAQLRTLGRALARIHGRSRITDHEIELLRRVVLSSVSPVRGETMAIFKAFPLGITSQILATHLQVSETGARTYLRELVALKLVTESRDATGWTYRPIPELAEFITKDVSVLHHGSDLLVETMKLEVSMPKITRRQFADAFKFEAVRLTRESGRPVAQVARELGISDNVLYRWRAEQQQVESQGRTRQAVRVEQDELTRLTRENETLRKERDFLKRAAAFFARESQ